MSIQSPLPDPMRLSEFDYDLPDELIAQQPLDQRDASRMLVLDRATQSWRDDNFLSLPKLLKPADVVVVNNTRVFPARLNGRRRETGGKVEIFLVREVMTGIWKALLRPGSRLKSGSFIEFGDDRLIAQVMDDPGEELRTVKFSFAGPFEEVLASLGSTPLPPYIRRDEGATATDNERYQTVYSKRRGAIAAPTAGLHFTPQVLATVSQICRLVEVTLHVGYGTFEPVRAEVLADHQVSAEKFEIEQEAAEAINECRNKRGRVVVVGTTTLRALESAVNTEGMVEAKSGETSLTIKPGYNFRVADALLTNFHLPQSSLLLLVSALAGKELILDAYRHAVREQYRFYSYGDCMFIR